MLVDGDKYKKRYCRKEAEPDNYSQVYICHVVAMSMLTCLEVNMFTKIANNSFYFSIFSPFPILKITLQLDI